MLENRTLVQAQVNKEIYRDFKNLVKNRLGISVRLRLEQLMEKDTFNIKTDAKNNRPLKWSMMNENIN